MREIYELGRQIRYELAHLIVIQIFACRHAAQAFTARHGILVESVRAASVGIFSQLDNILSAQSAKPNLALATRSNRYVSLQAETGA